MVDVAYAEIVTTAEVERASRIGVLSLMYRTIGTVNVSKTIKYGNRPVGRWVDDLRQEVKHGLNTKEINEFILDTDFFIESSKDVLPRVFSSMLDDYAKQLKAGTAIDFAIKRREEKKVDEQTNRRKALKKTELDRLERSHFAEMFLRLSAVLTVRGNLNVPRGYVVNGWDASLYIEELRAKKANGTLEPWKISALNNLGMNWNRSYLSR